MRRVRAKAVSCKARKEIHHSPACPARQAHPLTSPLSSLLSPLLFHVEHMNTAHILSESRIRGIKGLHGFVDYSDHCFTLRSISRSPTRLPGEVNSPTHLSSLLFPFSSLFHVEHMNTAHILSESRITGIKGLHGFGEHSNH